ncbi:hypothetical protein B0H10DRAFT_1940403 [Mycena sp. CBHHK59/15]|nr:hypothetical protein B0H10DRAFT_1940403 [Mycena sp. CBHHK59/15]
MSAEAKSSLHQFYAAIANPQDIQQLGNRKHSSRYSCSSFQVHPTNLNCMTVFQRRAPSASGNTAMSSIPCIGLFRSSARVSFGWPALPAKYTPTTSSLTVVPMTPWWNQADVRGGIQIINLVGADIWGGSEIHMIRTFHFGVDGAATPECSKKICVHTMSTYSPDPDSQNKGTKKMGTKWENGNDFRKQRSGRFNIVEINLVQLIVKQGNLEVPVTAEEWLKDGFIFQEDVSIYEERKKLQHQLKQ